MENKNLDKALDIISKLVNGENINKKSGENSDLYEEYESSAEVFELVHMIAKKMNLSLYAYQDGLYVTAGENNQVFGFRNDELKKVLGVRLNRELYLCYFIIYNVAAHFYGDSATRTFTEYIRPEEILSAVDTSLTGLVKDIDAWVQNEVEENSFKTLAMMWEDMPVLTGEESSTARAARSSKSGYVKLVLNFLESQKLLLESQERYYPTDRMKALMENYFEEHGHRLHKIMQSKGKEEDVDAAY